MSADFQILGSSSLGNCALLRTPESKILIDAGFSGKRIQAMLESIGESLDQINAVFLTHEHSDHAQGIRGLSHRPDLPIFANRDTADAVQSKLTKRPNWKIFETGTTFHFRDLEIRSFALPHDAYDPVGFVFRWGDAANAPKQSLAWITDLGYVPAHVHEQMRSVETLVIEANYDEDLLEKDTKRPWSIKQRIRGRHGHLSNSAAFEAIETMNGSSPLKNVYLAHLSKDCNSLDCVTQRFAALIPNKQFAIHIIDPVAL